MAWARCRQRALFSSATDAAHVMSIQQDISATDVAASITEFARKQSNKRGKGAVCSSPLRIPGQGTQQPERDTDKDRYKQPLIDIMAAGEVLREENSKASSAEYLEALERRAQRLCLATEIPTLHRAVMRLQQLVRIARR